jgi:hypothetical protein
MNINGKLDLFKNSISDMKLAGRDTSAGMKTTVMSPEEKAVDINLQLEQEKKDKEEAQDKKKFKKLKLMDGKDKCADQKVEKQVIERDPMKLLRLL